MTFIKEYVRWFVIINTGVLLAVAVNLALLHETEFPSVTLWQILLASAVTSIPTAIMISIEPKKVIPKVYRLLIIVTHYLCLLAIMLFLGSGFHWISLNGHGVLVMILSVAGVYFSSFFLGTLFDSNEAKKMNEALKNFRD